MEKRQLETDLRLQELEQLLIEKNEEVESVNGLYNDQDKRITELAELLQETKVALAGAANERDHLKERVG